MIPSWLCNKCQWAQHTNLKCDRCGGEEFTQIESIKTVNDENLQSCPECGGDLECSVHCECGWFEQLDCGSKLPFPTNEMPPDKYQERIDKTWVAPTDPSEELLKALMGVACESVEALNLFNRWKFKKKEFNKKELIDELGDVWYYLLKSMHILGITVDDMSNKNREKLKGGKHGWAEKGTSEGEKRYGNLMQSGHTPRPEVEIDGQTLSPYPYTREKK